MSERTEFTGIFVSQSEKARQLAPRVNEPAIWLPKSIFHYYRCEAGGVVTFSVEGWKVKDVRAAGFDET